MGFSADVSAGDTLLASHYNNLRKDIIDTVGGHDHDGVNSRLLKFLPAGLIVMWSGTIGIIPAGWALCDGAGGRPNLLAKFVRGVATAITDPGGTGGADSATLTATELPAHDHGGATGAQSADHSHSGTTGASYVLNNAGSGGSNNGATILNSYGANNTGSHTHSFTTGGVSVGHTHAISSAGSGQAFSILPTYLALAYIIKT